MPPFELGVSLFAAVYFKPRPIRQNGPTRRRRRRAVNSARRQTALSAFKIDNNRFVSLGCFVAAVLARFDQPPDHPVALACPETRYLKGLLCGA